MAVKHALKEQLHELSATSAREAAEIDVASAALAKAQAETHEALAELREMTDLKQAI